MQQMQLTGGPSGPYADAQKLEFPGLRWMAFLATGASLVSCYIQNMCNAVFPLIGGSTFQPNPHVQAVFMWGFALLATLAIARDRRHHGQNLPLALAVAGFVLNIGTLYAAYDIRLETLSYVLLVIAAFLNQNAKLGQLTRTVQAQAQELAEVNASLTERVGRQVEEIEQLARLKRFLAPEIAQLITQEGKEALLNSHRGFIACLFCDIRNFTALSEKIEPEEVMDVLRVYHRELGRLVEKHSGTIGFRAGDGMMVILNDPIAVGQPAGPAVALAKDMIAAFETARSGWEKLGYNIGFGIGLASGYATLGLIGDEGRLDYTAVGNVVNLAARLCDHAEDGKILINRRLYADLEADHTGTYLGERELKGFTHPVEVFEIAPS